MTYNEFFTALDAVQRRRHTDRGFLFTLLARTVAGDSEAEWPEYQAPEEGTDSAEAAYEDMERELASSPWVSHVTVEQQREMEAKNKAEMERREAERAAEEASV